MGSINIDWLGFMFLIYTFALDFAGYHSVSEERQMPLWTEWRKYQQESLQRPYS